MSSLWQPPIRDVKLMTQISKARKELGVHIYFDEPIQGKNVLLRTTIFNLDDTRTTYLNWTVVARATADNAYFVALLRNDAEDLCLEAGIRQHFKAYISKLESNVWTQAPESPNEYRVKKDEYMATTIRLKYPYKDSNGNAAADSEASLVFNGDVLENTLKFNTHDLKFLARLIKHHHRSWENAEAVEHHFAFTGVTRGLGIFDDKILTTLEYSKLGHMSAGGYAVISGSFKKYLRSYDGILLGLGNGKDRDDYRIFITMNEEHKVYRFRLVVSYMVAFIITEIDVYHLKRWQPRDNFVYIVMQNMEVYFMEIHTGGRAVTG